MSKMDIHGTNLRTHADYVGNKEAHDMRYASQRLVTLDL